MSNLDKFLGRPAQTLSLGRARQLYDAVVRGAAPRYRVVHVAGTNGKGSVAGKIRACLSRVGYRVGLYTSPHICSVHERITIDAEPISDSDLQAHLGVILRVPVASVTTFEALTISALRYFHDRDVDWAVVEVGLGGALDATNVVERPALSVITSIGFDHTEFLGDTIDEIAVHKAGIIKTRVPVVTGPTVPEHVVGAIADRLRAPHYHVQYDAEMRASYEIENRAIAVTALDVLGVAYDAEDVAHTPPCRFQTLSHRDRTVVLDAAHNAAAFIKLGDRLRQMAQGGVKVHVVLGMGRDKMTPSDVVDVIVRRIAPASLHVVSARDNPRAWSASEFIRELNGDARATARSIADGDVASTVRYVVNAEADQGDVVVICGSFYIMREAQVEVGLCHRTVPADPDEIGARHDRCIVPQ